MNALHSLASLLRERAEKQRRRIGIGVTAPTDSLIAGLRKAAEYCTPVLFGAEVPGFESVASPTPSEPLFDALEAGRIDAAVRGQIRPDPFRDRFIRSSGQPLNPAEQIITVLEFAGGRPLIVSPASNMVLGNANEKSRLIDASIRFCLRVGLSVKIGLLSYCRGDDLKEVAGTSHEQAYLDAEALVERYRDRHAIRHYEVDFEKAYEDGVTILIEPDGTAGNQVVRTLYFLGVARFYGAPYMSTGRTIVESFKNAGDYPDVLMLAAALVNTAAAGEESAP